MPALRRRTLHDLASCLGESNVGRDAAQRLSHILREDPTQATIVIARAEVGVVDAVVTLALADIDHPTVVEMARERYRRLLTLQPRNASAPWGLLSGYEETGTFIRRLDVAQRIQAAEQFLRLAQSPTDLEANRGSALWGIYNLTTTLPNDFRQQIFEPILALTQPIDQVSEIDQMAQQSQHLLSRFHLNFGAGALAQAAMITASQLASSEENVEALAPLIARWLYSAVPDQTVLAIRALASIALEIRPPLDLTLWADHPSADVRASVAQLAAQYPGAAQIVADLSEDPKRVIRLAIARSLPTYAIHASAAADDLRTRLLMDPSASVRRAALEAELPPNPR